MAEEPVPVTQLLRSHKARLIQILSGGADFVLQHADSRFLLSTQGYEEVNACSVPSVKVKKLLDHIIQRGPEAAQGLLQLLKERALQEAFPMLHFVNELPDSTVSAETSRKRDKAPDSQETTSAKKICNNGAGLVTEKQLMTVARAIGRTWKEIGREALDITSVKLEQIEEDHSRHVERVFAMLRYWRICRRGEATAAKLHSLLCQGDSALPPESIDFLLETD